MRQKAETLAQIEVFDWIRTQPRIAKVAFHIPNEGRRSFYYGKMLKAMGMKGGVSDICIPIARPGYHGIFIEIKAMNKRGKYNKPTENQMRFIDSIRFEGYYGCICNGAEETIAKIKWYICSSPNAITKME